jgi:hypothetical protein
MPAYLRQVEAFRQKFGREMGPQDPFFFDPRADTPQFRPPDDAKFALNVLVELMAEAGLDAEILYAVKRTGGLFPTAASVLTADEQREWDAAVHEYRARLLRARKQ